VPPRGGFAPSVSAGLARFNLGGPLGDWQHAWAARPLMSSSGPAGGLRCLVTIAVCRRVCARPGPISGVGLRPTSAVASRYRNGGRDLALAFRGFSSMLAGQGPKAVKFPTTQRRRVVCCHPPRRLESLPPSGHPGAGGIVRVNGILVYRSSGYHIISHITGSRVNIFLERTPLGGWYAYRQGPQLGALAIL